MSKIKRNEKGITMVSLAITIIVLLILGITITVNSSDMIDVTNVNALEVDISNLRSKVANFYNEYGEIPAKIEYKDISNLQGILNQKEKNSKFYVLDLQAMKGISLNYGRDYEKIKDGANLQNLNNYQDLYIINEVTHNIFYVEGIEISGQETRYTDYQEAENI